MLPEAGSPQDWLRHARSDLALAEGGGPQYVLLETLCFHAQQAVEKSIKAVLVHHGIAFPKVHSIERLIDLLPSHIARPDDLIGSAQLTAYATVFRYPGDFEDVTSAGYHEAVRLARSVVCWAESVVALQNH